MTPNDASPTGAAGHSVCRAPQASQAADALAHPSADMSQQQNRAYKLKVLAPAPSNKRPSQASSGVRGSGRMCKLKTAGAAGCARACDAPPASGTPHSGLPSAFSALNFGCEDGAGEGEPDDDEQHASAPAAAVRLRSDANRARDAAWAASLPGLVNELYARKGRAESSPGVSHVLRLWAERRASACCHCPTCGQEAPFMTDGAGQVHLVDLCGHAKVDWPRAHCPQCDFAFAASPTALGVFPGTPGNFEVVYTDALMAVTTHLKLAGAVSTKLWVDTLFNFHCNEQGCTDGGKDALWGNFSESWNNWKQLAFLMQVMLGAAAVEPKCAACWRVCHSLSADVCMGITRLTKAAAACRHHGFGVRNEAAA